MKPLTNEQADDLITGMGVDVLGDEEKRIKNNWRTLGLLEPEEDAHEKKRRLWRELCDLQVTPDKIEEKRWDKIAEVEYLQRLEIRELEAALTDREEARKLTETKLRNLEEYLKKACFGVLNSYNDDGKEHSLHDLCSIIPERFKAEIARLKKDGLEMLVQRDEEIARLKAETWSDEDMLTAFDHGWLTREGSKNQPFERWLAERRAAKGGKG